MNETPIETVDRLMDEWKERQESEKERQVYETARLLRAAPRHTCRKCGRQYATVHSEHGKWMSLDPRQFERGGFVLRVRGGDYLEARWVGGPTAATTPFEHEPRYEAHAYICKTTI